MEEKKKKEKKKKEKVDINLPKARASMKRSRERSALQHSYEDTWKLVTGIIVVLLIAFVLMGGINQGAALKTVVNVSQKIGETIGGWFSGGEFYYDNGIYYKP